MTPQSPALLIQTESLADRLRAACTLEAAARKPGNVHPGASFADLDFSDMLRAADVSAPILAGATLDILGEVILAAVQETRRNVKSNANLGILLLLSPLAASVSSSPDLAAWQFQLDGVLHRIDLQQSRWIYSAIASAAAGGLGRVAQQDVTAPPTLVILEAMQLAADRDLIARQYANGFADVFGLGRETFLQCVTSGSGWEEAVVGTHLTLLSQLGDTLIARKCGLQIAREAQQRANDVLCAGEQFSLEHSSRLREFDHWLRADGHRRNPGSTADLTAAILFVVLQAGLWTPPAEIAVSMSSSVTSTGR